MNWLGVNNIRNKLRKKYYYTFIGAYSDAASIGLSMCSYDPHTGEMELLQEYTGLINPTFMTIDRRKKILYILSEQVNVKGDRAGEASVYKIKNTLQVTLELTPMQKVSTIPAPCCHISLDHEQKCLMVSSYGGSMIGALALTQEGMILPQSDIHHHQGSSIHANQQAPHPHSITVDPSNQFALVCDLGIDQIVIYKMDTAKGELIRHSKTLLTPGSGPRHFVFHPNLPFGYVINELNSTITAYQFDADQGVLREIQTVTTLPSSYHGENSCADIHISADGKNLYGSNRGHDSLVSYVISTTNGMLTYLEHSSTMGNHPRNFAISPDDQFIVVANRDTNQVVTFPRDPLTGRLGSVCSQITINKPVCIQFFEV